MNWEQIRAWLLERIDELPWYRRWTAKAALWGLEQDLRPQAGIGCGTVVVAIVIGILVAIGVTQCT